MESLVSEKLCIKCEEFWPNDDEFFKSKDSFFCLACEQEVRRLRPYMSVAFLTPTTLAQQLRAARLAANNVKNKLITEQ